MVKREEREGEREASSFREKKGELIGDKVRDSTGGSIVEGKVLTLHSSCYQNCKNVTISTI